MDAWDPNRKINSENHTSTDLPTYPVRTVVGHVALKGVQAGSILGLVVGVPLVSYLRKMPLKQAWVRSMTVSPILGTMAALTMLYAKHYNEPMGEEGIDDRAYRIMHNKGQVRTDQYGMTGAAIGVAIGTLVAPGVGTIMASACTGVAVGVAVHVGESKGVWKEINNLVEELKKPPSPPPPAAAE